MKQKIQITPRTDKNIENLPWSDTFASQKDFVLVVGENHLGRVEFNLNEFPQALIMGQMGSGKLVLLRCLLWQCIIKGALVYMIDLNGRLEFAMFKGFGEVIIEYQNVLNFLKKLNQETQRRLELFRETGTKNFTEYNRTFLKDPLARIVLACDEVVAIHAADKTIFHKIKREMSSLIDLSDDVGINIFLTMRSLNAETADEINLPMVISSTNEKGQFYYSDGTDNGIFWSYIFQDIHIKNGCNQQGNVAKNARDDDATK